MGPAMSVTAESVNRLIGTYVPIGFGTLVAGIFLMVASTRLGSAVRRHRARGRVTETGQDPCIAFAEAVASGDLEAAEAFAEAAFAPLGSHVVRDGEPRVP